MQPEQARAARISALFYIPISLALALAFFIVASAMGKYTATAVYGGAAWVFLLAMIVTIPTITPLVKRRLKG